MNSSASDKFRLPLLLVTLTVVCVSTLLTAVVAQLKPMLIPFLNNNYWMGICLVSIMMLFPVLMAWIFWYKEQDMERECSRRRQALIERMEMEERILEENPLYQPRPISPAPSVTPAQQAAVLVSLIGGSSV